MNEHIIMQGTTSPSLPHSLCLFPVYHRARLITCPHTEHLLSRLEGAKVGGGEGEIRLPIGSICRLKEKAAEFYFFCVPSHLSDYPGN